VYFARAAELGHDRLEPALQPGIARFVQIGQAVALGLYARRVCRRRQETEGCGEHTREPHR
jgi:hypothetical protein